MKKQSLKHHGRWLAWISAAGLGLFLLSACHHSMPRRDINAVLADHDQELLAIPGAVGVAVGLLPDNKTECLKVLLKARDPKAESLLPRQIEGYKVIPEVTGEIRPMQ